MFVLRFASQKLPSAQGVEAFASFKSKLEPPVRRGLSWLNGLMLQTGKLNVLCLVLFFFFLNMPHSNQLCGVHQLLPTCVNLLSDA